MENPDANERRTMLTAVMPSDARDGSKSIKTMNSPIPKPGDIIEITARHCGGLQTDIRVGNRFSVKSVAKCKNGATTVIASYKLNKSCEIRINADRFDWTVTTPEKLLEVKFKESIRKDCVNLVHHLSEQEQVQVALVPLIYNYVAWTFAMRAVDLSVAYRVSILKKVTRMIRECRKEYLRYLGKDLPQKNIFHIESESDRFMQECLKDFTIFYFSVNSYFKKVYPNYPYDDLRTNAIIAMMIIRQVDKHNAEQDKMVAQRLGSCKPSHNMPQMKSLYHLMDAFAGIDERFDFSNVDLQFNMKILVNNISKIEFSIT